MQAGLLVVGIVLAVFGGLCFFVILLWPVGVLLAICAAIVIIHANRPQGPGSVAAVYVPDSADRWHHPDSAVPQPPPPPIPVVLPARPAPTAFTLPMTNASEASVLVWCGKCGQPQAPGPAYCVHCGTPLQPG